MNPDRIFSQHREDALAKQYAATSYSTFVAMPFRSQFSYRPDDVLTKVIYEAAKRATALGTTARPFARPIRVDSGPQYAAQVTEEIVVSILEAHFMIADMTFQNAGVVLEAGIALGLKPTSRLIFVMQGSPSELHFDINHNRAISYDGPGAVDEIAEALIGAAKAFEEDCDRYITSIKKSLTSEAMLCLNWYGRMQRDIGAAASLQMGAMPKYLTDSYSHLAPVILQATIRELLDHKLIWHDYQKGVPIDDAGQLGDKFGMHATELGWLVIGQIWPEIARANFVSDAATAKGTKDERKPMKKAAGRRTTKRKRS
jgi:hypothetical protein